MNRPQWTRTSIVMMVALFATMTLAAPAQALVYLLEERACYAEDDSIFIGDSDDVECDIACRRGDTLTVRVEAEDWHARVKGEVGCANAEADCGFVYRQCDAASIEIATYASGRGECRGFAYDIDYPGLSVMCTSSAAACARHLFHCDPGPCELENRDYRDCDRLPFFREGLAPEDLPSRAVEALAEAYAEAGNWTSRAFIWGTESGPIGASCTVQGCVILRPLCDVSAGFVATRCSVPMGAVAAAPAALPRV